jgi:biofilm protein TabA
MIIDVLQRSDRYLSLHPAFQVAFAYLREAAAKPLNEGRTEIDDSRIFAIVARAEGRGHDGTRLEAHRSYIDIQYVVEGDEQIGWRNLEDCDQPDGPFDPDRDIGFFRDQPALWLSVPPGHFAIFFPEDAHAPLAGSGPASKIVVKVAMPG